jgi:hypothetical protein
LALPPSKVDRTPRATAPEVNNIATKRNPLPRYNVEKNWFSSVPMRLRSAAMNQRKRIATAGIN